MNPTAHQTALQVMSLDTHVFAAGHWRELIMSNCEFENEMKKTCWQRKEYQKIIRRLRAMRKRKKITLAYNDAKHVAHKLWPGLTSARQYQTMYASHGLHNLLLPRRPDMTYKNQGWKSWQVFLNLI